MVAEFSNLFSIIKKNIFMKPIFKLFYLTISAILLLFLSIPLQAFSFSEVMTIQTMGMPIFIFFALDTTKLIDRSTMSRTGGGYTSFRFAPKDWLEIIPSPDPLNKSKITSDFVFKAGKSWIYIYTDDTEFELSENQADGMNNDGFTSELKGFFPGENAYLREFINEGTSSIAGYALIDSCTDITSLGLGKGKCCPASLKINFKSGKKISDPKGWEFSIKVEQQGVNCFYEGVGAMNQSFYITADDATPDVSRGTATYLIPANTVPTAITGLDNAVVGSLITLQWTSATNASTIASGATFQLAGTFTPSAGAKLVLQVTTSSTFAERFRYIPV